MERAERVHSFPEQNEEVKVEGKHDGTCWQTEELWMVIMAAHVLFPSNN